MSIEQAAYKIWWCPTCRKRIPQPRWVTYPGDSVMSPYHLLGNRDHRIEKVDVLDGQASG